MRLGTRWLFGSEPPVMLSKHIRERLLALENSTPGGVGQMWTLTWLEGNPVIELDDGTRLGTGRAADESSDW